MIRSNLRIVKTGVEFASSVPCLTIIESVIYKIKKIVCAKNVDIGLDVPGTVVAIRSAERGEAVGDSMVAWLI